MSVLGVSCNKVWVSNILSGDSDLVDHLVLDALGNAIEATVDMVCDENLMDVSAIRTRFAPEYIRELAEPMVKEQLEYLMEKVIAKMNTIKFKTVVRDVSFDDKDDLSDIDVLIKVEE